MEIILGLCIAFALGIFAGYGIFGHRQSKESSVGLLHIVKINEDNETYMFLDLDKTPDEVASRKYATFKVTQK